MNINTVSNVFAKEKDDVKGKVIRKSQIARQLLHRGAKIIDVKPDRNDPDHKRSVFVFEDTDEFQKIFTEILDESKFKREQENRDTNKLRNELEELKKKFMELSKESSIVVGKEE